MAENIDNEILISLVQIRPELWDKTLDVYKDRNATRNAWKDVCCEINTDFEDMEDKEKNEFGKAVIRRWTNLRDAFSKSPKKLQDCRKSDSGAANVKKYVYNEQMQFLMKLYVSRETADSLQNTVNSEDGLASGVEGVARHNLVTSAEKNTERRVNRKRRKPDEIELKMLKALEPEIPNSHMSFFQGVIPHLSKFDDSEVLEFQMGVLQVIANINQKRKRTQPPTVPYHPQQFSAPQPPSYPNPQPSCSSHFNPPTTFQTPFSQHPQFFNSQNNPFPHPTNPTLRREPSESQPTQQYFKKFGQSLAATSPDSYQMDSPSSALSESSENTIDFNILN